MNEEKRDTNTGCDLPAEIIRAVISLLVVAGLAVPAVVMDLPMLAVLPLVGVVAVTAFFGTVCGAVGAVVTAVCGAYTLSEGNGFVSYSDGGLIGFIALVFAAVVCVLFVSRLRKLYRENAAELAALRARSEADGAAPEEPNAAENAAEDTSASP